MKSEHQRLAEWDQRLGEREHAQQLRVEAFEKETRLHLLCDFYDDEDRPKIYEFIGHRIRLDRETHRWTPDAELDGCFWN